MELNPASDTWVDTVRLDAKVIDVEGDYSSTIALLEQTEGVDPQTGFAPIVWNAWETNWTGFEFNDTTVRSTQTTSSTRNAGGWINNFSEGFGNPARTIETTTQQQLKIH